MRAGAVMSSYFESEKTFEQCVHDLGMREIWPEFVKRDLNKFSVLVFATDHVLGSSSPNVFLQETLSLSPAVRKTVSPSTNLS